MNFSEVVQLNYCLTNKIYLSQIIKLFIYNHKLFSVKKIDKLNGVI